MKYLLFIIIFGCSKTENTSVIISNITKKNDKVEIDIQNYTNKNYFIISPQLGIYTMKGANMLNTKIVSHYYKSKKIDTIICKVYYEQCKEATEYDMLFNNYIVILPKKTTTKICYQYDENFDEKKVKYDLILGYNLNQFSTKKNIKKILELKKLFDNKKTDYELLIDEIKINQKLQKKIVH